MQYSAGDIADRVSILELKMERQLDIDVSLEYSALTSSIKEVVPEWYIIHHWKGVVDQLKTLNGKIWDLESDIRSGKEGELGLEEVGRRAILIRDINRERVSLKNAINKATKTGYMEVKHTWKGT
jgi:hypothetical protein